MILKSDNTLNITQNDTNNSTKDSNLIVFGNTSVSLQGKNNTININKQKLRFMQALL